MQSEWQEFGDGDYVTSLGHLAADMAGDLLTVANFAVEQGDHRATVWKVDAAGRRAWRSFLDDPRSGRPRFARQFVPAANGDALVVVARDEPATSPPWPHRLVRVAGSDGRVLWEADLPFSLDDSGPYWQLPEAVAEAPNGRILAVGRVEGWLLPRMVEFTADGAPCRRHDEEVGVTYTHAAGTAHGWSVLGRTSTRLFAQRFDATGACDGEDADRVFADGFDAGAAR